VPHHFDIASVVSLDGTSGGLAARSVGVGLSPGDESYPEPYFYVSPWPYPATRKGPALPAGAHWHTEGFFAAVLTGSKLVDTGDNQGEVLVGFLRAAVDAARELAGSVA
jgi:hypothetical protein